MVPYFLTKLSRRESSERPATVESDAVDLLASYDWPGNVRELENVINRLVVIAGQSAITRSDVETVLDAELSSTPRMPTKNRAKERGETKLVLPSTTSEISEYETITAYMRRVKLDAFRAAVSHYPNKTAAAKRLGLTKENLKRQMRYLRQAVARSARRAAIDKGNYE